MKNRPVSSPCAAFSLVEMVAVVAVLGILSGMVLHVAGGIGAGARGSKLESDVHTLNGAVQIYLANGGSLAGITDPAHIVARLKTVRSQADAPRYAGFRGSMLDARVSPVFQTRVEAASTQARARWNPATSHFEIARSGAAGIARFDLDERLGARDFGEEERTAGAVDYNTGNGWIWAYRDAAGLGRHAPTVVPLAEPSPEKAPAPSTPKRLEAPGFAPLPGTYDYPDFPTTVVLNNPNPPGSSIVYYATAWDGSGIQWAPYAGPLPVLPGMQVLACARPVSSGYTESHTAGGVYVRKSFPLQAPRITTSAPHLDLQSNQPVMLELIDANPDFALRRLEYAINGGSFETYAGPVSLAPADYAVTGLSVTARAVPAGDGFLPSSEVSHQMSLKLRMPVIELGAETGGAIPVSLSNPNPETFSAVQYALRNDATGADTAFAEYRGPFSVARDGYPDGFTVIAFATPLAGNYLASDEATSAGRTFFGVPVTGDTIFVLDRSGSMAWDDGIGQVKAEMNRVLDLLETGDRFGIVQFSTEASVVVHWTEATPREVLAAKNRVNKLTANGWTNYEQALTRALEAARNYAVKQVVFLSDGAPTTGDTDPDHLLSLVRRIVAEGTRVDALAFGRITAEGRELLERMDAAGNPGK